MSTTPRHVLHRALLLALRPFLVGSVPEAAEALDALLAWEPKPPKPLSLCAKPNYTANYTAPVETHEWRDYAQLASDHANAPKRARATLGKFGCKMRRCVNCGTVSNCAYPYWFKNPVTHEWAQRKPSCV